MPQNIYDNPEFFAGYATLSRLVKGLDGAPEWPTMQTILPSLQDKNILDLGCGYGWFCHYACDNQAASVMELDIPQKTLTRTHSMAQGNGIVYQRESLEVLTLSPNSFDLIYSSLALYYLYDMEQLSVAIYQSLVPSGTLAFSAEHPIYTALLNRGQIRDKTGQLSWSVNHYQQEGERISSWSVEGVKGQHRKLATWISVLIAAGFEIVRVDKWGPSVQQIAENPTLDEEKERPMVFLPGAHKPA